MPIELLCYNVLHYRIIGRQGRTNDTQWCYYRQRHTTGRHGVNNYAIPIIIIITTVTVILMEEVETTLFLLQIRQVRLNILSVQEHQLLLINIVCIVVDH